MSVSKAQNIKGPLVKSTIFVVVTMLVLAVVSIEMGAGSGFGDRKSYSGVFTDTSGILEGDSVRIAGVEVGSVQDISVVDNTQGKVTFTVDSAKELPADTNLAVRYLNLTGDRYLEVSRGTGGGAPLAEDAVIPVAQTRPALDLDVLLAGFSPLFEGLAPDQINQMSSDIISVFQGQGGTIESLLARVGSLTNTLADKDAVIGSVVDNLNTVLGTLDKRAPELESTIGQLQELTTGLANDRERIGNSLEGANRLTSSVDELLGKVRGPLKGTVDQLDRVSKQAKAGEAAIDENLALLPGAYLRVSRLGSRGATYNLFICSVRVKTTGPAGDPVYSPWVGPADNVDRCKFGNSPLETPEQREANPIRQEDAADQGQVPNELLRTDGTEGPR
ncbi:MCE-family protein Mce1B [Pseudonocardia sp. Ae168_Ps1]|uniref:MCE family protein n=1 Tax=unclassified Pseudonocardia TaxID=2619320 RepID=UPI00094B316B|nr:MULTISPECIES: MlaD family protein [unclassified Pseudonocardia]OLL76004.1 MCE-family protein Mce1B [Pseudonocardia sp. Ae150A_Ps1]OLL82002.1 MCE-family protein Mce1B [Pseudonocardia sp. Ae168_Ps1]OLL83884.1 MCE-family protein Mce1B [Pseudonocardia sp. Ae263_Ps1]OLL96097.1 MCE-family protein Mce1B [Pseudonocardia sp. Ae356_Ps1]